MPAVSVPDGLTSLYLTFAGDGRLQFAGFTLNRWPACRKNGSPCRKESVK